MRLQANQNDVEKMLIDIEKQGVFYCVIWWMEVYVIYTFPVS